MAEAKKSGKSKKPRTKLEKINREKKIQDTLLRDPMRLTKTELLECLHKSFDKNQKYEEGAYCYLCGQHKSKKEFYVSTDPLCKSGVTPVCKDCAKGIARRRDQFGNDHEVTKESLIEALFYLNKPFYIDLYQSSIDESSNVNHAKKNPDNYDVYASYIKNIAMPNYYGKTWRDSDYGNRILYEDEKTAETILEGREDQDTYVDFLKNKADVKRLLSYDPFEKESIDDQPFLYSQLLGLLDSGDEENEDMLRTASCITIVRGFLQQSKIDDAIATLMADTHGFEKNSGTIKSLQDSKAKITTMITGLAEQSKISLKSNKGTKRGANTFTGKLKMLKDLQIRDSSVNGFDIATCKGMQQVANISMSAIIDKLRLDESEWSDMVAEQRDLLVKANNKANAYGEAVRILLRENLDLRDRLSENNLIKDDELVDLDNIVNTYIENSDTYDGDNHD